MPEDGSQQQPNHFGDTSYTIFLPGLRFVDNSNGLLHRKHIKETTMSD